MRSTFGIILFINAVAFLLQTQTYIAKAKLVHLHTHLEVACKVPPLLFIHSSFAFSIVLSCAYNVFLQVSGLPLAVAITG